MFTSLFDVKKGSFVAHTWSSFSNKLSDSSSKEAPDFSKGSIGLTQKVKLPSSQEELGFQGEAFDRNGDSRKLKK